jgi:hypothetical protein
MSRLSIHFGCNATGLEKIKRRRSTTLNTRSNLVCTTRQPAQESELNGPSPIGTLFLACAQTSTVAPQPFQFNSVTCFLHKERLSWVSVRGVRFQRGLVSTYIINGQRCGQPAPTLVYMRLCEILDSSRRQRTSLSNLWTYSSSSSHMSQARDPATELSRRRGIARSDSSRYQMKCCVQGCNHGGIV